MSVKNVSRTTIYIEQDGKHIQTTMVQYPSTFTYSRNLPC